VTDDEYQGRPSMTSETEPPDTWPSSPTSQGPDQTQRRSTR